MTRHRPSIAFALSLSAMAAATSTGCNLDLEDLLDDGMATDGGTGDAEDTEADPAGTDGDAPDPDDPSGAADSAADSAADTSGGADEPSEIPAELLGAWITGNDQVALAFEFYDDGSYAQALYYEYDDGGCYTVGQEGYVGAMTVDATTIVLSPVEGFQSLDQCGTLSEGAEIGEGAQLSWSLGADDLGDALTLDDGTEPLVFHRSEGA